MSGRPSKYNPKYCDLYQIMIVIGDGSSTKHTLHFLQVIDIIKFMSRGPRLLLSQSYYHVMTRGNNKNIVFRKDKDFKYYMSLVSKYKDQLPFDLYHYTLMPNHTHFLIRTRKANDFSLFMKKLNLSYFYYFKTQYGWVGHLWQDRFKSQPVGKDEYFIQCGKYIEHNPVRANIVDNPKDYLYSSYNYYAKGKPNSLITPDFIYEKIGKDNFQKQSQYQKLIIDQIVEETYKKHVWGSNHQRYREQDKINRNLKKCNIVLRKEPSPKREPSPKTKTKTP